MTFCRNKVTVFVLLLFINLTSFSQNNTALTSPTSQAGLTLRGKAVDEKTNIPIDFATVSLVKANETQAVAATQTDIDGNFSFKNIKAKGSYKVIINFIGYNAFSKTISLNNSMNLGILKLKQSASSVLNEVVVTGTKDVIQLGIDRKVFNADQSLATQGGTATDLLATIPSVQVDLDGNISLRGTNNVKVMIDGKPSTFGGGDVTAILQSLPANAIEKVELITNPSAKYDPEGQSGIINIVLKRSKNAGMNGNVNLSAGKYESYNAGIGLNFRNEKWNLSGNYNYREGDRRGSGFNSTQFLNNSNNPFTSSTQIRNRFDSNHTIKFGSEYFFTPKTSLGLSSNLNLRKEKNHDSVNQLFFGNNNEILDRGPGFNRESEDNKGYDINLDFYHKFKTDGEELSSNISFGNRRADQYENIVQEFFDANNTPSADRFGMNRINDIDQKSKNWNFQLDYTRPFSKTSKLELGYRSTMRYNDENQISDTLVLNTNIYERDKTLSNLFELEDIVHAVYSNYQNQLTDNFGVQVGLRAEQAYLNTDISGLDNNNVMQRSSGRLDYLRVYPSIYLTQKLKGDNQLQLSYSRRVNRPRGWQVNPFPDVSDRYHIRIGNPNLKPEDIHAYEFSYAKFWKLVTFTSSIYFRQVNDVVQSIRKENPDQNGGTISEFYNIARSRSAGLELISRANITKSWNITGNINLFRSYFKGDESLGINDNDGFNWNGSLNSTLSITKALAAQANFFYMAPRTTSQGKMREMMSLDAGLKYDIFGRKASLGFNMQDILNSRKFGMYTNNQNFIQEFERRRAGRMFNFSLNYRFGKTDLNSSQKRSKKGDERPGIGGDEEMGF
ncbi:TonB-dependent receptor plug [Pseudopedobacter saltans DSM 12145]|uniref:TonB-dependent receptor plug n=1 Tax=Pseudopedobacter saltans (strain ATCC 51119 / DSM 12145 / JCM 21818 / CCUG 39354 / LMG 10337 / NBRC 100064 / NCIMB 13643) TaxID=762903 RepID=F0S6B8_PSESL|nr:outer membrane beta-barrel family protein [Pseudopedobacter saltans]ADY53232.1 TonB-dependent receptor plug [Pseudopedobacter saltans DSM 12145]